MPLFEFAIT